MARDAGIDAARGLGIAAVVVGHSWWVLHDKGEPFRVLFSFHMPLFFLLAGLYLRVDRPLKAFARQRADALLKPYVVTLLALALYRIGQGLWIDGALPAKTLQYFGAIVLANGRGLEWFAHWFLPQLFLASLVAWWVLRRWTAPRARAAAAALLLAAGIAWMRAGGGLAWPWSLDLVPTSAAFVIAGTLVAPHLARLTAPGPTLAALLGFVALHAAFDATLDLNLRRWDDLLVTPAQAVLGSLAVVGTGRWLAATAPRLAAALALLGEASLFVLMFHVGVHRAVTGWLMDRGLSRGEVDALAIAAAIVVPVLLWRLAQRVPLAAALLLPRPAQRAA